MNALVVRGSRALARPEGSEGGIVPSMSEVSQFLVIMESYDHGKMTVVTNFTGSAPVGWRWIGLAKLQGQLSEELAGAIGQAMLVGGP